VLLNERKLYARKVYDTSRQYKNGSNIVASKLKGNPMKCMWLSLFAITTARIIHILNPNCNI